MKPFLTLFFLLLSAPLFSWRSYNRFHTGAAANSIGGAFVADGNADITAHLNPAGLTQIEDPFSFSYEVSGSLFMPDIFAGNYYVELDYFPFFSFAATLGDWSVGASLSTLFDSYGQTDLSVRLLSVSAAYPLSEKFSLGISLGPVFLKESTGNAVSFYGNIGALWALSKKLQLGISIQSPFQVNWNHPAYGSTLTERFPLIAEVGIAYEISKTVLGFFSLDYTSVEMISYTLNGEESLPNFSGDFFARVHPHFGIRFLEALTGAHLSAGFLIDSSYSNLGSENQYRLTAGIRFFGKRAIFDASVIDSLLLSWMVPYSDYEEEFNVSLSYRFGED